MLRMSWMSWMPSVVNAGKSPGIALYEGTIFYIEDGYNTVNYDPDKGTPIFVGKYKIRKFNDDNTIVLQKITRVVYSPPVTVSRSNLNNCVLSLNLHDENVGMSPGLKLEVGQIFIVKIGNDSVIAGKYQLDQMLSSDLFVLDKGWGYYPRLIEVSRSDLDKCTLINI